MGRTVVYGSAVALLGLTRDAAARLSFLHLIASGVTDAAF